MGTTGPSELGRTYATTRTSRRYRSRRSWQIREAKQDAALSSSWWPLADCRPSGAPAGIADAPWAAASFDDLLASIGS